MFTIKTVSIGKKVKRVSLQRYLWSVIAYEDKVTFRILGGLILNQLWLEDKSSKDREFSSKFKQTLEVSSTLLKEFNLSRGLSPKALSRLRLRAKTELEAFLVPKRNYGHWRSKFDSSVILKNQKPQGVETKKLPPERYIGIGYRDKGSASKPEIDGSPSWQEVATSSQNIERKIKDLLDESEKQPVLQRIKTVTKANRLLQELSERLKSN